MDHQMLQQRFAALTTAHLADACIRAQVPVRRASALLRAVVPGSRLAGRVCPARHAGSVDAFLEAFETAAPGDVLVVDNGGLLDEACVGDLVALEAHAAGMEGIVIWGLHRDTADIRAIGLPVFSPGAIPTGPLRLDARPPGALESAVVGDCSVTRDDLVLGVGEVGQVGVRVHTSHPTQRRCLPAFPVFRRSLISRQQHAQQWLISSQLTVPPTLTPDVPSIQAYLAPARVGSALLSG